MVHVYRRNPDGTRGKYLGYGGGPVLGLDGQWQLTPSQPAPDLDWYIAHLASYKIKATRWRFFRAWLRLLWRTRAMTHLDFRTTGSGATQEWIPGMFAADSNDSWASPSAANNPVPASPAPLSEAGTPPPIRAARRTATP